MPDPCQNAHAYTEPANLQDSVFTGKVFSVQTAQPLPVLPESDKTGAYLFSSRYTTSPSLPISTKDHQHLHC